MQSLFTTTIREIGIEAPDLLEKGVLILFQIGAPPELAEVSVLHETIVPAGRAPVPDDVLDIDGHPYRITAVGDSAWRKMAEMGHVVFSFNGATQAERPGEICVQRTDGATLQRILSPGAILDILGHA